MLLLTSPGLQNLELPKLRHSECARRRTDIFTMASPSVPPATVEWSRACTLVRPIPHPAVSLQARMTSIATVYAQAKAAANGSWSTIAVLAAMRGSSSCCRDADLGSHAHDLMQSAPLSRKRPKRRLPPALHAQLCDDMQEGFDSDVVRDVYGVPRHGLARTHHTPQDISRRFRDKRLRQLMASKNALFDEERSRPTQRRWRPTQQSLPPSFL